MPRPLSLYFLAIASLLSISFPSPTYARFFPNVSSIPPELVPPNVTAPWDAFRNLSGCGAGDRLHGLANLKTYFRYFGYIPVSVPANFSDDFDDELESAIKTYQKNFNLNVTGLLDDPTLNQIVRPRCGNADIVNGTTTMNSGKTTSMFHTVAHYSFFPGNPRWPSGRTDLTYAFLPDNQLTAEVKSVFARAFQRWSEVIPLTFTETDSYDAADIKVGFYNGDHGDGEPFDGVLGTLAHAFSPPSGRFHLDGAEDWVVSGDASSSTLPSAVDLESVAVHEIGHLLGLGHSSVEEAIMYPTISSRSKKVVLAADDIEGIQYLYGSNPNYNGSSTTEVQQRDTSGSYRLEWAPLHLVLAVVLFVQLLF